MDGQDQYGYDTYDTAYSADQMQAHALAAIEASQISTAPTPSSQPIDDDFSSFELLCALLMERDAGGITLARWGDVRWHIETKPAAPAAPIPDQPLKDHEIAQVVNTLRDVALQFHGAQQLRERIAHIVVPLLKNAPQAAQPTPRPEPWRFTYAVVMNPGKANEQVESYHHSFAPARAWAHTCKRLNPSADYDIMKEVNGQLTTEF